MFTTKQLVSQLKLKPNCMVNLVLQESICHKSELPPQNVKHWNYEKREWGLTNFFLDPFTKKKFNENSKIIQVEGNIKCGKNDFARRLADELGMKLMPPIDLESYYINDHGYDYRALNSLLPERLRICDWQMFHENPSRHSIVHMFYYIFKLRLFQYIKALQHLFNTGQGVILVRSVFTDRVFIEAMHNVGWLPMGYLRGDGVRFYDYKIRYNFTRSVTLSELLKPHLTIYLDTPVETCTERIKNSSDPITANSNALVPEFLENIERAYKDIVLPKQDHNGHVLKYAYPERKTDDEIMDVIDDINKLDFEHDFHDTRFLDWDTAPTRLWWAQNRRNLTTLSCMLYFKHINQPWFDIAGLGDSISEVDLRLRSALFEGHVGPVGFFRSLDTDLRVTNPLKVFLNHLDFGKKLNRNVRTDFV